MACNLKRWPTARLKSAMAFLKARKGVVIEVDPDSPRVAPDRTPPVEDEPQPVEQDSAPSTPESDEASRPLA